MPAFVAGLECSGNQSEKNVHKHLTIKLRGRLQPIPRTKLSILANCYKLSISSVLTILKGSIVMPLELKQVFALSAASTGGSPSTIE